MSEFQLADSIATSIKAQEPWPNNVKLFQPFEAEQILLPDNASCIAVQAFLKMCNLPFEVEMRWNAEFMSPSGRVPFIKCADFIISELEPIVQFVANKGVSLCGTLTIEEKAEMRAYMSLINNILVNAELYISWMNNETYYTVTKIRNSSVYPCPLGWLQTNSKRNQVAKRLKALHWADKTLDQVLADVEQCCNSLSHRLADKDYFFGTDPTPLDALTFGHIRALLSAKGPKAALMIKSITSPLLKHVVRVSTATGLKLTAQEDYLITQAFQVSRLRLSSERSICERSIRKRSKLNDTETPPVNREGRNSYGFRPFASKQIILSSNVDEVVCAFKNDDNRQYFTTTLKMKEDSLVIKELAEEIIEKGEEKSNIHNQSSSTTIVTEKDYQVVNELLHEIVNKVEDISTRTIFNQCFTTTLKMEKDFIKELIDEIINNVEQLSDDKHDFEIVYPEEGYQSAIKMTDFLETIEENDKTSTSVEDLIHDINDDIYLTDNDITKNNMDNDGVVIDKFLEESLHNEGGYHFVESDDTGSSNKLKKDLYMTVSSSGDKISRNPVLGTEYLSESMSTQPSNEEISVEGLLKCLRERNAMYGELNTYGEIADVD